MIISPKSLWEKSVGLNHAEYIKKVKRNSGTKVYLHLHENIYLSANETPKLWSFSSSLKSYLGSRSKMNKKSSMWMPKYSQFGTYEPCWNLIKEELFVVFLIRLCDKFQYHIHVPPIRYSHKQGYGPIPCRRSKQHGYN